jgi:hypothetical protein
LIVIRSRLAPAASAVPPPAFRTLAFPEARSGGHPYRAFVDFDEPEPLEEFDDDDLEDDDDDRNILTDGLDSK